MRLSRYRFGECEIDPASRELSRCGERIALPPKSFDCLVYLLAHRDRAVGRDELIAAVWGRVEVGDAVVAQTLLRARKALDDAGDRQAIVRTVPRFGYRWIAPVQEVRQVPQAPQFTGDEPFAATAAEGAHSAEARRARWIAGSSLLLVLVAGLGWGLLRHWQNATREAVAHIGDGVLVLPVLVSSDDSEDAWVRLGAMDYVASRLRRSGLKVVPSDQTLHLSAQFGEIVGAKSDTDAWRRLQAASGVRWVVAPEAMHERGGWRLRLNLREGGQPHVIEARATSPLAAAALTTDSWLRRLGRSSGDSERTPNPLTERVQQVVAELLGGQLAAARRLIETAPPQQRRDPRLRVHEGQLEYRAGRIDDASRIFGEILAHRPAVDSGIRAEALMGQGAVDIRRNNFAAAESHYAKALTLLKQGRDGNDPALVGNAYNGRGIARIQQGRMEAAVQDMGLARIAMQRSGDLVEAAVVGANLGKMETERGHFSQALQEFDRAIAVFQRFDVVDYLAATLMSKAEAQLLLVQPMEAADSIGEADALAKSLEDPYLVSLIRVVRTRVLLATGRIREAAQVLAALRSSGMKDTDPDGQELLLRLHLAHGELDVAGALARRDLAGAAPAGPLVLAAVQAALLDRDPETARAWLSRTQGQGPPKSQDGETSREIARALLARDQGDHGAAVQVAREALAHAERSGSPEERVEAGLLQAKLLLEQGRRDAAAAILGDLDAFVASDYRVAWATLSLYRALGDAGMTATALARVQTLCGERDINREPSL